MRTCATATTWRLNLAVLDFTVLALSAAALGRIRGRWGSPVVGPPLEAAAVHGLDARCDDDHREAPPRVAPLACRACRQQLGENLDCMQEKPTRLALGVPTLQHNGNGCDREVIGVAASMRET